MRSIRMFSSLIFIIGIFLSSSLYAQTSRLSFRLTSGMSEIPWRLNSYNNIRQPNLDTYKKQRSNSLYSIEALFAFTQNHFLSFESAYTSTKSSMDYFDFPSCLIGPCNPSKAADGVWKFHIVPISLGYEYRTPSFLKRFTPIAGIGMTYLMSDISESIDYVSVYEGEPPWVDTTTNLRSDNVYGIYTKIGLLTKISGSVSFLVQAHYRNIDPVTTNSSIPGKTGKNRTNLSYNFSGYSFIAGIQWNTPYFQE